MKPLAMPPMEDSGLPPTAILAMQQVFAGHPRVTQVILYGSRALGSYRPGSDIDLTVIGELDYQELQEIDAELDDLMLPYKVDLSLFKQLENSDLIEHIQRAGKNFFYITQ